MNPPSPNVNVVRVQRPMGHDIEGKPRFQTTETSLAARFQKRKQRDQSTDREQIRVTAFIIFTDPVDLSPRDLLTIEVGGVEQEFEVGEVGPEYDGSGAELWQRAELTQKRVRGL